MPARLPALTSVSAAAFTTSALRSFARDQRLPISTSSHHIGASAPARSATPSAYSTLLAAALYVWHGRSAMPHAPAGPTIEAGAPISGDARLRYSDAPLSFAVAHRHWSPRHWLELNGWPWVTPMTA